MLTVETFPKLQVLLAEHNLDGWLLFDFRGSNPIARAVLGDGIIGTRRVYVLIPRSGVPIALIHEIDAELWTAWPAEWGKSVWVAERSLHQVLAFHLQGLRVAVDTSPRGASPYLDCVPAGAFEQLKQIDCKLLPSVDLVTRLLSVWTKEECDSHERAAAKLAEIAEDTMRRVRVALAAGAAVTEYDVIRAIRQAFDQAGLETEGTPSVCFGANAARNHYRATESDCARIVPGELLLVDLWAKEPGGMYADQTWMASIGPPSERDAALWTVVRDARDAALGLLIERVRNRKPVTGADVDWTAKRVIAEAGWEEHIASRTGHSIDRFGLHGFGPPIDGTETRDERLLIPGVGFSVEPGIYIKGQTGVRSEVNAYVTTSDVVVTPRNYQKYLTII
jgi:Xaa-Pro dipeptidase